jgi:hypothetical protein
MSERSMSKLLTGVVGLLFTFVGLGAEAQTGDCTPLATALATATDPARIQQLEAQLERCRSAGTSTTSSTCSSLPSQITTAGTRFSTSQLRRAQRCDLLEMEYGEDGIDADDDDYNEEREMGGCSSHLNSSTCPEENAGQASDYRTPRGH